MVSVTCYAWPIRSPRPRKRSRVSGIRAGTVTTSWSTAGFVHLDEEPGLELVGAQEHAVNLRFQAAGDPGRGSHPCPVQAVREDGVPIRGGADVKELGHAGSTERTLLQIACPARYASPAQGFMIISRWL